MKFYMTELMFLKLFMLITQVHIKNVIIYRYTYFLDKGFKFQSPVCNNCHDVLTMSIDNNSIAILNIHGADYCCIIFGISKTEAISF